MRGWRLSYRWRRRAILLAVIGVMAGGIATAVILLPTGERTDGNSRPDTAPGGAAAAARTVREPPSRRPSPAERKAMLSTVSLFISTAVARHHPERAYDVVDSSLREGMTRKQWSTGLIPVVPFPAAGVDLVQFIRFRGDSALIEVFLEPARGSHLVRKTFQIELRLSSAGKWLVSSWVPEGVSQSQIDLNRPESPDVIAKAANPPRLSTRWIYLPLGILILGLVLTPLAIFGRHAYAHRRARKRYLESLPPDDLRRYELRR